MRARLPIAVSIVTIQLSSFWIVAADDTTGFEREIAPLLVSHCLDCHQPTKRNGKLNLSTLDSILIGGEQGPALTLERPAASLLLERVVSGEMPPPEQKGHRPLTEAEKRTIRTWVLAGAPWPKDRELGIHEKPVDLEQSRQFWSFQPVRRPAIPQVSRSQLVTNPIDSFVWEQLKSSNVEPWGRADRGTLIRRLSLDVRGLPPSPAEVSEHLNDRSPDAYERLVDRQLADPAHGERWTRYWLDVVRYADSNDYERDSAKPSVWRYRDYIIASLNSDKPYDRFVLEQIAGDELADASSETLIATGFHALGAWQDEVDPLEAAQYRADELDDMVRTTAQAFLGLTLGCARCHNHKFDPLTMVDYYSLTSILAPLKRPNKGRVDRDLPLGTPEQLAKQKKRDEEIDKLQKQIAKLKKDKSVDEEQQVSELNKQISELRTSTPDLPAVYRCFEEATPPVLTHLLLSGRASNPGPVMQPRVPAVLTREQPTFPAVGPHSSLRRLTLARWIASEENPLTARVIVNRVWQHHFGEGIVATPSDFGQAGARPTHPELLDWLADWFMHDAEWSLKKLHRLIVTSETYQQRSEWNEQSARIDPENRLLWRFPYRRLDVEAIRDSMLAVAGNINRQMYGPAVYLPIQQAAIEAHTDKQAAWKASPEPAIDRRTVYAFVKRTLLVPMLETLDFCDTTQSTDRRAITSVAPQALTLFNGDFVNRQAEQFAQRLKRDAGGGLDKQLELAYSLALAREPAAGEMDSLRRFFKSEADASGEQAALVQVCRVILNLNEFVYPN